MSHAARKRVRGGLVAGGAFLLLGGCAATTITPPVGASKPLAATSQEQVTDVRPAPKVSVSATKPTQSKTVSVLPAWSHLEYALSQPRLRRTQPLIQATHRLLDQGDPQKAIALIHSYRKRRNKENTLAIEYLHVRALTLAGQPESALDRLKNSARLAHRKPHDQQTYNHLELNLLLILGRYDDALRLADQLGTLPSPATRRGSGYKQLWQHLKGLSTQSLRKLQADTTDLALLHWIHLVEVHQQHRFDRYGQSLALAHWQKRYPDHPASQYVLPTLVADSPFPIEHPRQVALLLPLNSRYQGEAEAFSSGVLFMHESDNHPNQPTIKLYDTGQAHQEIRAIYEKAIAEGADFVIGPLGRQAIDQLVSDKRFPVPTLLIGNPTHPTSASPNVYQLGMAPEQDGMQLARRAYAAGYRRALIIFSASDWGRRVSTATSNDWTGLGGKIVAQAAVPVTSDHSAQAIRRLFHLDHSAARAAALKKVLTHRLPFKAIPRRRQDVDVIFLFCSRPQAQVINPQIDFLYGHDLPVFSTSHLYHGTQDRLTDLDLDGIILGDMPWILGSNGPRAFRAGGRNNPNTYRGTPLDRLFALGMDAYALSSRIIALRAIPEARYAGFSGQLSSDQSGVIRRKLMWAQFENAKLIAMPQPNASPNEGGSYLHRGDDG